MPSVYDLVQLTVFLIYQCMRRTMLSTAPDKTMGKDGMKWRSRPDVCERVNSDSVGCQWDIRTAERSVP